MSAIKRTLSFIFKHPLAKRHKIRSLYRLMKWQLISRLNNGFIEVDFLGKTKFLAKKGMTGITGNIYAGLHEFEDMAFLLHFLRKEDVFFDIGANVGAYTLLASGSSGAFVTAFEPVASTFQILKQNIHLNKLEDLVLMENNAVGAAPGNLIMSTHEDTTNHVLPENEQSTGDSVTVTTVDLKAAVKTPVLMKIDVEGFETEVLKGSTETLNNPVLQAIIIELNGSGGRYGYHEEDLHQYLLNCRFKPYRYDPFKRDLSERSTYGDFNTIYIRDLNFVKERLLSAKKIKILGELI